MAELATGVDEATVQRMAGARIRAS